MPLMPVEIVTERLVESEHSILLLKTIQFKFPIPFECHFTSTRLVPWPVIISPLIIFHRYWTSF